MKKMIFTLFIAALAMPVAAMAGQESGKHGKHFERADVDGDGFISADEHAAMAAKHFAKMDANGDGKLSKEEIKARWKKGGHHKKDKDS